MKIPVIITCAVKISDTTAVLKSEAERMSQYRESILTLIEQGVDSIIICENSNSPVLTDELLLIASRNGVELEQLIFSGDKEAVKQKGKGYGEGQMMEFVLNNSQVIRGCKGFVKITGRLILKNIMYFIKQIQARELDCLFFRDGSAKVDTRFYYCQIGLFNDILVNSYEKVNDIRGVYLEHVYLNALALNCNMRSISVDYPLMTGISGSTGLNYDLSLTKYTIKNILSKLGLFAITRSIK